MGKHCHVVFSAGLGFCSREITHAKMQLVLNQNVCFTDSIVWEKTQALFGKDAARKKLHFCIHYLWKTKEKPAN